MPASLVRVVLLADVRGQIIDVLAPLCHVLRETVLGGGRGRPAARATLGTRLQRPGRDGGSVELRRLGVLVDLELGPCGQPFVQAAFETGLELALLCPGY